MDLSGPVLMDRPLLFSNITAAVILPVAPERALRPRPTLRKIRGFHGK